MGSQASVELRVHLLLKCVQNQLNLQTVSSCGCAQWSLLEEKPQFTTEGPVRTMCYYALKSPKMIYHELFGSVSAAGNWSALLILLIYINLCDMVQIQLCTLQLSWRQNLLIDEKTHYCTRQWLLLGGTIGTHSEHTQSSRNRCIVCSTDDVCDPVTYF